LTWKKLSVGLRRTCAYRQEKSPDLVAKFLASRITGII